MAVISAGDITFYKVYYLAVDLLHFNQGIFWPYLLLFLLKFFHHEPSKTMPLCRLFLNSRLTLAKSISWMLMPLFNSFSYFFMSNLVFFDAATAMSISDFSVSSPLE